MGKKNFLLSHNVSLSDIDVLSTQLREKIWLNRGQLEFPVFDIDGQIYDTLQSTTTFKSGWLKSGQANR